MLFIKPLQNKAKAEKKNKNVDEMLLLYRQVTDGLVCAMIDYWNRNCILFIPLLLPQLIVSKLYIFTIGKHIMSREL